MRTTFVSCLFVPVFVGALALAACGEEADDGTPNAVGLADGGNPRADGGPQGPSGSDASSRADGDAALDASQPPSDASVAPAACDLPAGVRRTASSFGAVGDGVADDTEALQEALEALATGGVLELAANAVYRLTGPLALNGAANFGIAGNGATLKVADDTPPPSRFLLGGCNGCVIRDLVYDGNRENRTPVEAAGAHALAVYGGSNFAFCNVTVRNSTCDGFYVAAADAEDADTFPVHGVFYNSSSFDAYRQGMSIINGNDIQVLGGEFSGTHGTAPSAGIDLEPNDNSANPGINDVLVRGVRFEHNDGAGLTGGGSIRINRITIEDSVFVDNARRGGPGFQTGFRFGFMNSLVQRNTFSNHGDTNNEVVTFRGSQDTHTGVFRQNIIRSNQPSLRAVEIATTGPAMFLVDNEIADNSHNDIHTHGSTTACLAGNLEGGELDAPAGTCGALPVVGYAP